MTIANESLDALIERLDARDRTIAVQAQLLDTMRMQLDVQREDSAMLRSIAMQLRGGQPPLAAPLTAEPLTAEPLTAKPLAAEPLAAEPVAMAQASVAPAPVSVPMVEEAPALEVAPALEEAPASMESEPLEEPKSAPKRLMDVDITRLTMGDAAALVAYEHGVKVARSPDLAKWMTERGFRPVQSGDLYRALLAATKSQKPRVVRAKNLRGGFEFVAPPASTRFGGLSVFEAALEILREKGETIATPSQIRKWLLESGYVTRKGGPPARATIYLTLREAQEAGQVVHTGNKSFLDFSSALKATKPLVRIAQDDSPPRKGRRKA